ncbi:MAG: DUF4397 domain-containing protein [Oscillospiraceae bacterium]|nr:DUF4397 domain-containing protein [Oscillospiraceae bacterium]
MSGKNRNFTSGGERAISLPMLKGGLNLSELEYRLKSSESPDMENLLWREGALCSRDGQEWLSEDRTLGVGYAMYERLFKGFLVAHIGTKLYALDPQAGQPAFTALCGGIPANRGSWFPFGGRLYYKNRGSYTAITCANGALSAAAVEGYIPVTVLNASPTNGAGDLYQPENRIQAQKTVKYNAEAGTDLYHLPLRPVDAVTKVAVDGVTLSEGTDYTVNAADGTVRFAVAPPVTSPPTNNTVEITYAKADTDGCSSIMDCVYAVSYGGTGELCAVLGGCPAQPNALFWSGNNAAADPSYFPYEQYQLAGDTDDPITGFGKQQSFLVVFKKRSVGRVKQDLTTVDGRLVIDMPYTAINDRIGCDLPASIRLIDNNLVWCSTEQGVHVLKDSSYAYENNIECLSGKVNGGPGRPGLLAGVRAAAPCSLDDTRRYWLCCGETAWVWDYENSSRQEPSWYRLTGIGAVAFASEGDRVWHLNAEGQLTRFARCYADYGAAIPKSYRFAAQDFGGYDRLKNVNSVVIAMRPDTDAEATLSYITDYGTRTDPVKLRRLIWHLCPRNLRQRVLNGAAMTAIFRRRPMCRRVRRFAMRLENRVAGEDLSVVSAQIFYQEQGRFR